MPLPQDLEEFCIDLRIHPGQVCVTFPGGSKICAMTSFETTDPADMIRDIFKQINSALAPLVPIFDIIDFAVAAFQCISAIPDALGPPPDPKKLAHCIPQLAEKAEALLRLLPQISIPILAKELIKSLVQFLEGVKGRLRRLITRALAITAAETRAATLGSVELQTILDCATGNLEVELHNLNEHMTPVNRLIGLVNAFLDLAGLPCIPSIQNIGAIAESALAPLDKSIELLWILYNAIPAPEVDFNAPGAFWNPCADDEEG